VAELPITATSSRPGLTNVLRRRAGDGRCTTSPSRAPQGLACCVPA
jgi:hypothetical protein